MTVKEFMEIAMNNYDVTIYEENQKKECEYHREFICNTKTDCKGLKPYYDRTIIGFELYCVFAQKEGAGIKLYLEAEKC